MKKEPKTAKRHPLLIGLERFMHANSISARQVAIQHLGVTQQTLHEWVLEAKNDSGFKLPPHRALQLAKLFKVRPHLFRPDLWHADDKGGTL